MDRSYRDRLAAIEARNDAIPDTALAALAETRLAELADRRKAKPARRRSGRGPLFTVVLGVVCGAAALFAGSLIDAHFFLDGGTGDAQSPLRPGLLISFFLILIADLVVRDRALGRCAIMLGFLGVLLTGPHGVADAPALLAQLSAPEALTGLIPHRP